MPVLLVHNRVAHKLVNLSKWHRPITYRAVTLCCSIAAVLGCLYKQRLPLWRLMKQSFLVLLVPVSSAPSALFWCLEVVWVSSILSWLRFEFWSCWHGCLTNATCVLVMLEWFLGEQVLSWLNFEFVLNQHRLNCCGAIDRPCSPGLWTQQLPSW